MRVDLRCGKAGVAEQGLDASQIGAVVEQMCGEAVAKLVRAEVRWQAGFAKVFFHRKPDRTGRQPPLRLVDKEGPSVHTGLVPVARNRLQRWRSHGTDPFLGSLSKNADRLADGIKIPDLQPNQFGEPYAARIKELEDRFVPACHPGGRLFLPHTLLRASQERIQFENASKISEVVFPF